MADIILTFIAESEVAKIVIYGGIFTTVFAAVTLIVLGNKMEKSENA